MQVSLIYHTVSNRHNANICVVDSGLVTEVYSQLRVCKFVAKYGLRSGHATDIKTCDDQGNQ